MEFTLENLELLRQKHPAWRLLCADQVPLVVSFLHKTFVLPNVRVMREPDLADKLQYELFPLRQENVEARGKPALDYLKDWSGKGWLRRFYNLNDDVPHYDLTPATEKAILWLTSLTERSFVGTESRLLTLFGLLRQMAEGSETDPAIRIAELQKRRDEIDREISRIEQGDVPLLTDTALKDRFQQFNQIARELLMDFREVEHNFRLLDRRVRERITLWEGAKGELLEEILGERDAIASSDQGLSFRAFWDFLMSSERQEELAALLERVLQLPAVLETGPDARLRRVHHQWLEAGGQTQRTVAQLSRQLSRFLDDQAWLENRRIMEILHDIHVAARALRESPPEGDFMSIAESWASIELPMERPLYTPPHKPALTSVTIDAGDAEVDVAALFSQVVVDKAALRRNVHRMLQSRSQVTLREVLKVHPLAQGLAELVGYLQVATEWKQAMVIEDKEDVVEWDAAQGQKRQAHLPRILFLRDLEGTHGNTNGHQHG